MTDHEHPHQDGKFLLGFFLGGLLGAIVLFFVGTKEGKKTGLLLKSKGHDLIDDLVGKLEALEERGIELVEQGEEIKEHLGEELSDKKEEITKEASVRIDAALANIEKLQEQGKQNTALLRKKLFKNIPKKS